MELAWKWSQHLPHRFYYEAKSPSRGRDLLAEQRVTPSKYDEPIHVGNTAQARVGRF